jgi:hypothetical protein
VTFPPLARKVLLTAHVTTSVGWLGAVVAFAAVALVGANAADATRVRAAYLAADVLAWFVILPFALGALVTGVVQSLGTPWGLLRHYWVTVKLVLTVVATAVLLTQLGPIDGLAAEAGAGPLAGDAMREPRGSLVVHAVGGVVVLLVATVLSVFKPKGMTAYGRRRTGIG